MTSPHTDLDLTDAVEAAAAAQWTQRVPSIPWERVVATNPVLAHGLREQVLPIVTAAAPIIAAALTRAHAESNERALPSVEDMARALWELSEQEADTTGGALDVPWSALDSLTQGIYRADAEDLLALIPSRAEAEVKAEGWDEGLRAGEAFERARWQWSAGAIARVVNGLAEQPERPANPYRAAVRPSGQEGS